MQTTYSMRLAQVEATHLRPDGGGDRLDRDRRHRRRPLGTEFELSYSLVPKILRQVRLYATDGIGGIVLGERVRVKR